MENKKNVGTATATARRAYDAKVGMEAFSRAGKNPQLKGVVHEVLYKDIQTVKPGNLIKGTKGVLSKSTTAVRDDVLLMNGGKVVGRAQLKDTANSISKTVKQAASGKYSGTNLMGTKETVEAFNKAVGNMAKKGTTVTQKMTSTGISSVDTTRIAAETIGGKVAAEGVKKLAKSSGVSGGLISGGIEVISSGKKLFDGEIDGGEFVENVVKETAGGGISAAGGSVAGTAVATAVGSALATTTAPVWAPAVAGVGAAMLVGSAIKGIWDSIF